MAALRLAWRPQERCGTGIKTTRVSTALREVAAKARIRAWRTSSPTTCMDSTRSASLLCRAAPDRIVCFLFHACAGPSLAQYNYAADIGLGCREPGLFFSFVSQRALTSLRCVLFVVTTQRRSLRTARAARSLTSMPATSSACTQLPLSCPFVAAAAALTLGFLC